MLKGSCLCGAVRYEVEGDQKKFYHCHCARCRKASGTGHASNVLVMKPSRAEFVQGDEHLSRYKLPDAKWFSMTFCRQCGSRMPNISPERGLAVIPAGSLDNDPGIAPEARIFLGSKASWSCDENVPPGFDEYPG